MDNRIYTDASCDASTSSPLSKDEKIANLENEIIMLNSDLYNYKNELERLTEIVSEFQHIYTERTHQTELEINTMYENLNRHINSFHAMLIVKNKEDKDESNIP